MGLFDFIGDLFGGEDEGEKQIIDVRPPWQEEAGSALSSWAQKFLSLYQPGQPYGGALSITKPTELEGMGLSELTKLLSQPVTGALFDAAKGNVLDTLSGKFADPATSPFIQAFSRLAGQNLQDSINTARGQRGARGTFFTRAGIQEESRLGERTQNMLNTLIQEFINSERGRQQTAVGQARDLEGYATDASIKRVTASQTLGSLQRILEQADLERRYQDWLNQRRELSGVPGIAASVAGMPVPTRSISMPSDEQDIAPWIKLVQPLLNSASGDANEGGGGKQDWGSWLLKAIPTMVSLFA